MDLTAAKWCIFHSGKVTKFDRLLSDDLQQMSVAFIIEIIQYISHWRILIY